MRETLSQFFFKKKKYFHDSTFHYFEDENYCNYFQVDKIIVNEKKYRKEIIFLE